MKKASQARFPQSALLFKFCLAILQHRRPTGKINEQEIGNFLNYNPSDTTHWKSGKKSIRSIYAIEALAQALDVDFDIIHDVVDGTFDFDSAWFEFIESEEIRNISLQLTAEEQQERRNRQKVLDNLANELLVNSGTKSLPVFAPELVQAFPFISLNYKSDMTGKLARSAREKPGIYSITTRKGDMTAHQRAAIAREISRIVLFSERSRYNLPQRNDKLLPLEIFDFANSLLVPADLFKQEVHRAFIRVDFLKTLSDIFWVPRFVIRFRMTDIILSNAPSEIFVEQEVELVKDFSRFKTSAVDLSEDDSGRDE